MLCIGSEHFFFLPGCHRLSDVLSPLRPGTNVSLLFVHSSNISKVTIVHPQNEKSENIKSSG